MIICYVPKGCINFGKNPINTFQDIRTFTKNARFSSLGNEQACEVINSSSNGLNFILVVPYDVLLHIINIKYNFLVNC